MASFFFLFLIPAQQFRDRFFSEDVLPFGHGVPAVQHFGHPERRCFSSGNAAPFPVQVS